MSSIFAMQTLLFAGELFVASTIVMALAALASFQKSASRRHLVWLAAFAILLALPILVALSPSLVRIVLPAPAASVASDMHVTASMAAAPTAEPATLSIDSTMVALATVLLWIAGVFWVALRGIVGAFGLWLLRYRSVEHRFGHLPVDGPRCDLRISTAEIDCGPVTWGIFRPVILLPRNSVFWSRERLEAVLQHELAHIHRRDCLAQALSQMACALYWPNPFVWLSARALRREAEIAADDAVIVSGIKPSAYAGELLELAAEFQTQNLSPAMPLFMAARSSLEERVKSVLSPTQQRSGVTKMDVFKIVSAGLLATTALVLAHPSFAQDAPAAPAAPSVVTVQAAPPVMAAQAEQPAPPSPAMGVAPPAPPVTAPPAPPPVAAVAPPPPAPDVMTISPDDNVQVREEVRKINGRELKRMKIIVTRAKEQAREAMAKAQPDIERAMAEAKMAELKLKVLTPKIQAELKNVQPEIDKALAEAREELAKSDMDVKVKESVDKALKRVEIRIEERQKKKDDQSVHTDDQDSSQEQ